MTLLPSPTFLPEPGLLPGSSALADPPAGWLVPTVDDVAALLTARTYDDSSEEVGTFNDATRPTGEQVQRLIEFAAADVAARVGIPIPEMYWPEARRITALQAAALVESSFFPREIAGDESAYRQYTAMFLAAVPQLVALITAPTALNLS